MKIKFINHDALECQTAVEQPSVWRTLKISVGALCLMECAILQFYIRSAHTSPTNFHIFEIVCIAGLLTLWTVMIMGLKHMYPGALVVPREKRTKTWRVDVLILLFAAILLTPTAMADYHMFQHITDMIKHSRGHTAQLQQSLITLNKTLWEQQHFGSDPIGIAVASVCVLTAPFFEEIFFRGYMLNRLCQKYHPFTAVIVSAFWFTVSHVFSKTMPQMPWIFLGGICCGMVRLLGGRWQNACSLHFLYNFGVVWPMILVAILRYHLAP
jgi:membrane protease YdiL (CAAX protease family)